MRRLAPLLTLAAVEERGAGQAIGTVLTRAVRPAADLPALPTAYTDGWAVNADDLIGASPLSAAILVPPPHWVDAGDAMRDADAVLPPEAVTLVPPDAAEAVGSVVPGEGVRLPGQDIAAGELLLDEGVRLMPHHIGVLRACGVQSVMVRVPQVRIVIASAAATPHADMVHAWLAAAGAKVTEILPAPDDRDALAARYREPNVDLVLSLGGTGQGRLDCAVAALGDAGSVAVQGIALRPGHTSAFGSAGSPVLLLPGRLDALVAGLLTLAMPALAGVSGLRCREQPRSSTLAEKVISTVGLSELFLGLPAGDAVRPVPLAEMRLDALAQSVGWFLVQPELEGLAAGEAVHLRSFYSG